MLAVGEVGGLVHVLESSGRVRLCSIDASHHGPLGWIAWLPSERPGGVLAVGCDANRRGSDATGSNCFIGLGPWLTEMHGTVKASALFVSFPTTAQCPC